MQKNLGKVFCEDNEDYKISVSTPFNASVNSDSLESKNQVTCGILRYRFP